MKFGIVLASLIYLVSCNRRAELQAANLRSRELLAARIRTTFDGDKTGFQVTSALPASSESQNQSKIQSINQPLVKQVQPIQQVSTKTTVVSPSVTVKPAQTIQFGSSISKPVQIQSKKEETVQPITFTSIGKQQTFPIISTVPPIQSKIIQSQIPFTSTASKPQQILITSTTKYEPQSNYRQVSYPIQGTNMIRGLNNQVLGQQNILDGNSNKIDGNQNIAIGNQNNILGMRNDVTASNAIVKGNKNIVTQSLDVSNLF